MINDCWIERECRMEYVYRIVRVTVWKVDMDRRCVWDGVSSQDSKGFLDIYRKRDFKRLLSMSMGIWDSKCVWYGMWLQGSKSFQDTFTMVGDHWIVAVFGVINVFGR